MQGVLSSMVIDTAGDHNLLSYRACAQMYLNVRCSATVMWRSLITEFPNARHLNELMIVGRFHRAQRAATTSAL